MKQRLFIEAASTLLVLGSVTSLAWQDEDDVVHSPPPTPATDPSRDVSLEITEDVWLRAPGAEWFAARAEEDPGRFSFVAGAVDGNDAWVDSQNEYQFRMDPVEEEYAYWQFVSAERLTRGRRDYVQFCASCHGFEGDGLGRSGQHLRPPPRSFKQSNFKFTKVVANLPTDEALLDLVKRGLDGTPMLTWELSDEQLLDIIQYIKSLSPPEQGWRDVYVEIGDVVGTGDDPWSGRVSDARARGEQVYHDQANCHACHPGYVTSERLAEIRGDAPGTQYREDLSYPALKESNYHVREKQIYFLPPDFTWHQLRAGTSTKDLVETIAAGIKGTAMPQWKGALTDEDLWALAHYVEGLIVDYKDQPAARSRFMGGLRNDQ